MALSSILKDLQDLTAEARGVPKKTQHIGVGKDQIAQVGPWLAQTHPGTKDLVVCDAHTKEAAADAVVAALQAAGRDATLHVLQPRAGEDHVMCADEEIAALQEHLAPQRQVNAVAVGAGSVNDIVKMATAKLDRPYQCVATAASMNGYTSAIAAVLSRGVKRTLPAQQAQAVFADVDVLCKAPAYLNLAGFGDLLSKPYSNADWRLSAFVRGVPYEERPAKLLDTAFDALLDASASIGKAEAEGIELLAATIILSGFTMAIAGTSAPASGGEHLVSHYWDMEQHCRDLHLRGLHGTQVGIATRMSAMLFERLVGLQTEDIDPDAAAARIPDAGYLDGLAERHHGLTPAVVEEVRAQIEAKQRTGAALRDELAHVKAQWPEIRETLRGVLMPSDRMRDALAAVGAPSKPSDLTVTREHAVRTLTVCREIRSRYVAMDLIADLGRLPTWATEVVDAVEG
ncbi:MAG: iron-containing alcohol dehydrogenase [Myxococcota bacterium]